MKIKYILLVLYLLMYAGSTYAQAWGDQSLSDTEPPPPPPPPAPTQYYNATKTFVEQGYTYQADDKGLVVLYNKANQFTNVLQMYKNGRGIPEEPYVSDRERNPNAKTLAYQIVANTLSAAEKSRIKRDERLDIRLFSNSETGAVIDVQFTFAKHTGFNTIPVSTWRRIELELKRQIHFVPNAEGRRKNYLFTGWLEPIPR